MSAVVPVPFRLTEKSETTVKNVFDEDSASCGTFSPKTAGLTVVTWLFRAALPAIKHLEVLASRSLTFASSFVVAIPTSDGELVSAANRLAQLIPDLCVVPLDTATHQLTGACLVQLLSRSELLCAQRALFQAPDVVISTQSVAELNDSIDLSTPVVGAWLASHHSDIARGKQPLTGSSAPRLALALWQPALLAQGLAALSLPESDLAAISADCAAARVLLSGNLGAAKIKTVPGLATLAVPFSVTSSVDLPQDADTNASVVFEASDKDSDSDPEDMQSSASTVMDRAAVLAAREAQWVATHTDNQKVMSSFATGGIITAADYFESIVDEDPGRLLLQTIEPACVKTYGDVDRAADQVAHWAHSQQWGPGDAVALAMENAGRFIEVWLGLAKAGVTVACINTNLTGSAVAHAVLEGKAKAIIVSQDVQKKWDDASVPEGVPVIVSLGCHADNASEPHPADTLEALAAATAPCGRPPAEWRRGIVGTDALFYIYTSGTTGRSKAAVFSHTRFIGAGVTWARAMQLVPTDVFYVTLPLYHGNGGCVAVSAVLRSRCSLVLRQKFSVRAFLPDVRAYGATATIYIGELWRYLYNTPGSPDDAVNPLRVACGNGLRGDIWRSVVERFGLSLIVEHYGQTEMPSAHPMINSHNVVGSCGFIPPNVLGKLGTECLIRFDIDANAPERDENGHCIRCGPGQEGESIVRLADGQYRGYTSDAATDKAMYRNVFEEGDVWYHSGDLLRFDHDGYFFFVDRVGDSFRWKGENVATGEVCEAVGSFAGIAEANVYGVSVPGTEGRAGMASVVPTSSPLDVDGLAQHIAPLLPAYARPLFLRVAAPGQQHEKTSTFKFKNSEAQAAGFNPSACAPDQVYFRDDAQGGRFVPVDPELYARLSSGVTRL